MRDLCNPFQPFYTTYKNGADDTLRGGRGGGKEGGGREREGAGGRGM
jgi:hypothetical protein